MPTTIRRGVRRDTVGLIRRLWAVLSLTVLPCVAAPVVLAQGTLEGRPVTPEEYRRIKTEREMNRRVALAVALVDPADQRANTILRRKHSQPHDVVLLSRADADGARLATAVKTLLIGRDLTGDTAKRDFAMRIPAGPPSLSPGEILRAQALVDRLRSRQPEAVEGVGTVATVTIYLPSKAMRKQGRELMEKQKKKG